MSARDRLGLIGRTHPWSVLRSDHRSMTFFRWDWDEGGQHRREVNVIFDKAGRVTAWTTWRNYRDTIDQQPGQRKRLQAFMEAELR